MKDITIVSSSTDSVTFIVNNTKAFVLASRFPSFVQTRAECQTLTGLNFRAFESLCWRSNISVADAR